MKWATLKKKLNPGFTVKSGKQESFIQFLLFVRRIQTIHEGLRWFDIKRYGIEVDRRVVSANGKDVTIADQLLPRDPRCAIQLPQSSMPGFRPTRDKHIRYNKNKNLRI